MSKMEFVHECLLDVGIKSIVAMPDSGLAPICHFVKKSTDIKYIQTIHESSAIGISSGLTLVGTRNLVLMENSGLRNACESLARLNLSHHIFTTLLISDRGDFGERNWWGISHHETMYKLLDLFKIRWSNINSLDEFPTVLVKAFDMSLSNQCSIALIARNDFLLELKQ